MRVHNSLMYVVYCLFYDCTSDVYSWYVINLSVSCVCRSFVLHILNASGKFFFLIALY